MEDERIRKKLIENFEKCKNNRKYQIELIKYILYKEGIRKYAKK